MKALVLEDNAKLKVHSDRPLDTGPAGENNILVKIAACGVCGSDIPRGFEGKAYHYPLVMGHEFSAIVVENKPGSAFSEGDRVAVFPLIPLDKTEPAYFTGDWAQLKHYDYFGSRRDGAFSEYLRVPEVNLIPIPEHVNIRHASMTEPAAVALHGVRRMKITTGDTGVVLGGGPIGVMCAQWLRLHGCQDVIVTDVDERKLKIVKDLGLITVNVSEKNPVNEIMEITDGKGAEKVIEAVGLPQTFLQALEVASRGGEVVFMGNINGTFSIGEKEFSSILRRELSIFGTWNSKIFPRGNDDWTTVLKYMDKELIVEPLISDYVTLEDGPEVFQSIVNRQKFHNKVIFDLT